MEDSNKKKKIPEPSKRTLTIAWIVVGILVITLGVCTSIPNIREFVIARIAACLEYGSILLAVFFFFWCAIFGRCKNRKKKILLTILGVALVIAGYFYVPKGLTIVMDRFSGVVHMKEDVLYVHPAPKPQEPAVWNADSIYDGGKNDPNLKRDTTNNK
jgi:amino acid permease